MKSAWVVAKQKVEIKDIDMPEITEDGVMIQIKSVGICGSDIGCYMGEHPFRNAPSMLGHEMSGCVTEVGKKVVNFKKGDRVAFNPVVSCGHCAMCKSGHESICENRQIAGADGSIIQGTMAEYICAPESHVRKIADDVSYDCGSLIEPMSVAVHAMKRFTGEKKSILIYGTGVIGLCSLLYAKDMGYQNIYCVNRGKFKRDLALELGATAVFNPNEVDLPKELKKYEPNGINAVMLSVANEQIMKDLFDCMSGRGEICYVYQNTRPVPTNFTPLVNREYAIMGSTGETMEDFDDAVDYVNRNTTVMEKLITKILPMNQTAEAVELMQDSSSIKVIVHPEE